LLDVAPGHSFDLSFHQPSNRKGTGWSTQSPSRSSTSSCVSFSRSSPTSAPSESGGSFAGSRTFPLLALYGALVQAFFPGALPVAFAVLVVPLTTAYVAKIWYEDDIGLTTLVAALVIVVLGALTTHSERGAVVAIVVGGAVTVLLAVKDPIHEFADQIEASERRATTKFILVVLVVLPALPDHRIDALYGLNPQFVWLMVVFVTGLGFVAYLLGRILGPERGIALTGLVGGFVSSTATTVSMAEKTNQNATLYHVCAFAVVTASIVMFPRALIEVAVVNPALLPSVAVPLGAMSVVGVVAAVVLYWQTATDQTVEPDEIQNPFRLRPALAFGVIFAVVLLVSESANDFFGSSGVYATAFFSGLADVDAMTITLSQLAAEGTVSTQVATTGIVIAAIANTFVKVVLAWFLGSHRLGRLVATVLGVVVLVGVIFLQV